jgi:MraZ protein
VDLFVSHFAKSLDAKGRVSLPPSFRAVLARDGFEGLYVHPSLDKPALDAGGHSLLQEIRSLLSRLSPYSDERDEFSTALLGTSEILKLDPEGRVTLTETLKTFASIRDEVVFVGLGEKFQIWEPERFRAHLEAAREKVRALKRELGSLSAARTPEQGARE